MCSWIRNALESELISLRSEIEIIRKSNYLYEEFHEEVSKRLLSSSQLNSLFAGNKFEIFKNILLFDQENVFDFDANQIIDPFSGSVLYEKKSFECNISFSRAAFCFE